MKIFLKNRLPAVEQSYEPPQYFMLNLWLLWRCLSFMEMFLKMNFKLIEQSCEPPQYIYYSSFLWKYFWKTDFQQIEQSNEPVQYFMLPNFYEDVYFLWKYSENELQVDRTILWAIAIFHIILVFFTEIFLKNNELQADGRILWAIFDIILVFYGNISEKRTSSI